MSPATTAANKVSYNPLPLWWSSEGPAWEPLGVMYILQQMIVYFIIECIYLSFRTYHNYYVNLRKAWV